MQTMRPMQAILASGALLFSVAAAQAEKSALDEGLLALRRGQAVKAAELFSAELNAQETSQERRARAFYLRAKAYAALGEPGRARSDVMLALWLGKLSAAETADAQRLKARLSSAQSVGAASASDVARRASALPEMSPATVAAATPTTVPAAGPTAGDITAVSREPLRPVKVPSQQTSSFAAMPVERVPLAPVKIPKSAGAARMPSSMPTAFAPSDSAIVTVPTDETPANAALSPWVTAAPVPAAAGGGALVARGADIVTGSVTSPSDAPGARPSAAPEHWQSQVAPSAGALMPPGSQTTGTSGTGASVMAAPPLPAEVAPTAQTAGTAVVEAAPSGGGLSLFGGLFGSEPSPNAAALAEADAAQRRYLDKIRRHNEAVGAAMDGNGATR